MLYGNRSIKTNKKKGHIMPATDTITALVAEVEQVKQVDASAIALLNGIAGRIQAAVDAALAGGATAAQVAAVQAVVDDLTANTLALSAAVAANT